MLQVLDSNYWPDYNFAQSYKCKLLVAKFYSNALTRIIIVVIRTLISSRLVLRALLVTLSLYTAAKLPSPCNMFFFVDFKIYFCHRHLHDVDHHGVREDVLRGAGVVAPILTRD